MDALETIFQKNVGNIERGVRIALGLALLLLVFVGPKTAWGLLGAMPLLTGVLGMSPLYQMLGVSTCPKSSHTVQLG